MPKAFPPEFRADVVAVARRSSASMAQIARDFGVSESCLARWLKVAHQQDGLGDKPGGLVSAAAAAGPSPAVEAELAESRRRVKQLEQENEVLRRATAYFARDVLPK